MPEAQRSGLPLTTLYRRLQKHDLLEAEAGGRPHTGPVAALVRGFMLQRTSGCASISVGHEQDVTLREKKDRP